MRTLLASLVIAVVLLAATAHAQPLVFVGDVDFAPYSMLTEGRPAGIDVEVLAEAARRAGIEIAIKLRPWDEVVRMLETGECAGGFALFRGEGRSRYVRFLDAVPIHTSDFVLFTMVGGRFSFRSFDDLADRTVARVGGMSLGDEFDAAVGAGVVTVRDYPDQAAALAALIAGDVDAYAGNIDVTYARLKDMGMTSSIVYLPRKLVSQKPAYAVLSLAAALPEREEMAQRLERAMDQMRRDGTYRSIAHRYLLRF
ncbi:transporter substrate-binding domain-containing protein [Pseudodesulfovibrio sp. F-1]|uniref:Transporter substrate-binding domain-containing protein n=1 Tax=Pseudodesulfovibrio alkaliphilus TaxID=2661613 RepID=A0A7K1KNH8_9BACT|nr:transporter substrate-binding domain-containing protein [Pseudodesulfovibrio alkaliphilus]MUM77644.1 transporter substrate-binding domain-containing protein [Pseudodesulfovibrio alkaliphilus]